MEGAALRSLPGARSTGPKLGCRKVLQIQASASVRKRADSQTLRWTGCFKTDAVQELGLQVMATSVRMAGCWHV